VRRAESSGLNQRQQLFPGTTTDTTATHIQHAMHSHFHTSGDTQTMYVFLFFNRQHPWVAYALKSASSTEESAGMTEESYTLRQS
jgi:hypothetical protein